MAQQALDDFYNDEEALALAYAAAVNEEIKDLFAAGADVVQIDEPYMQAQPDKARRFGINVLNRALAGVSGVTAIHLCFGYALTMKTKPRMPTIFDRAGNLRRSANLNRDRTEQSRSLDARSADKNSNLAWSI